MPRPTPTLRKLLDAASALSRGVEKLRFADPVKHVYNPLDYAWPMHERFIRRFGDGRKRVVFLGMNPGPWGMAQTGVPFGEVAAVRDWMRLDDHEGVTRPQAEHPKRPVLGLACERSEVSGRRLWGLMQARFGEPETFFRDHWVANYCPLVFMEQGGRNRTPDKLPADERDPLAALCDQHLEATLAALGPAHVVGVGQFAQQKMLQLLPRLGSDLAGQMKVSRVLHPSPASPAANRGWAEQATRQLVEAGVWPSP